MSEPKQSPLMIARAVVEELGNCVFQDEKFWWYGPRRIWTDETVNVKNTTALACNGRDVDKVLKIIATKYSLPSAPTPYFQWVETDDSWKGSGWEPLFVSADEIVFSTGTLNLRTNVRKPVAGLWGPVINLDLEELPDLGDGTLWPEKFKTLIDSVRKGLLDEEMVVCFQDCFSFLLRPHVHFRHALYLTGPAGSRKSTIATAFALAPCGSSGVSRVSERRLGYDERFASSALVGKVANLSDDMAGDQRYRDWFKSYTGNGIFQAEFKYTNPQNYPVTAKLISTCNQMPLMSDSSDALASRILMFDFKKLDHGAEPELVSNSPHLSDSYWSDKDVRLHIVAWLLQGARRVVEAGETFRKPVSMVESIKEYIESSDPVRTWLESRLLVTGAVVDFISSESMLSHLNDAGCVCTPKELATHVERMGGKTDRRTIAGNKVRGFSGVKVRDSVDPTLAGPAEKEHVVQYKALPGKG